MGQATCEIWAAIKKYAHSYHILTERNVMYPNSNRFLVTAVPQEYFQSLLTHLVSSALTQARQEKTIYRNNYNMQYWQYSHTVTSYSHPGGIMVHYTVNSTRLEQRQDERPMRTCPYETIHTAIIEDSSNFVNILSSIHKFP